MDYIFSFPDDATLRKFTDLARENSVTARWITIDPNPEHDHEWRFTDELIFESVFDAVQDIINQELAPSQDSPVWPETTPWRWTTQQKRDLVNIAVTKWGFLGNNGPIPQDVISAYEKGLLPLSATPT